MAMRHKIHVGANEDEYKDDLEMTTAFCWSSISGLWIISALSRSSGSPTDPKQRNRLNSHVVQARAGAHTAVSQQKITSRFDITECVIVTRVGIHGFDECFVLCI